MEKTTMTEPFVWIGCMACYNNGDLIGRWVDAATADEVTPSDLHGRTLPDDVHDELWCYDHEGIPVHGELDPITAAAWGRHLADVPEHWRAALCAWVESGDYVAEGDGDLPSLSDFEERYVGHRDSFSDYAYELADEIDLLAGASDEVERHFNWDSWISDLRFDYAVVDDPNGGVYVFRSM